MKEVKRIGVLDMGDKRVEIYGDWDNPLFTAIDIASWIKHTHTTHMVSFVDSDEKTRCKVWRGGQMREMLMLTVPGVKVVLANTRKPRAKILLSEIDNSWRYINTPKEAEFALMLRNMLETHEISFAKFNGDCNYMPLDTNDLLYLEYFRFEEQYKVLDYHVDFYFPELMLVVEYDEKHHANQEEKDKKRMDEIVNELAKGHESYGVYGAPDEEIVNVIRVKEGGEFEGLVEILTCMTSIFV